MRTVEADGGCVWFTRRWSHQRVGDRRHGDAGAEPRRAREWHADYFAELQSFWATFGAKPHWGKTFDTTLDFEQMYGDDWRRFNEIRKELDPNGLFLNDFMRHVFKDTSRSTRSRRPGRPEEGAA